MVVRDPEMLFSWIKEPVPYIGSNASFIEAKGRNDYLDVKESPSLFTIPIG